MRRHYRIEVSLGPEQVFRALRETKEDTRLRGDAVDFDFDWLKRRAELSAATADGAERAVQLLLARFDRIPNGGGVLLPGKVTERSGRHAVPIGMLLSTAEELSELVARMISEIGVPGVRFEHGGAGFSYPSVAPTKALGCEELVRVFPLPPYARVVDEGERP